MENWAPFGSKFQKMKKLGPLKSGSSCEVWASAAKDPPRTPADPASSKKSARPPESGNSYSITTPILPKITSDFAKISIFLNISYTKKGL